MADGGLQNLKMAALFSEKKSSKKKEDGGTTIKTDWDNWVICLRSKKIEDALPRLLMTVKKEVEKFPHSPILHCACGSMHAVFCFATKKQQKQRIVL